MVNNITRPKVFISYSWTNKDHEEWVLDLATRLVEGNGVDVVLDKWDLKEGHDKYAFMESMVTSKEIDKVLIICDSGYKTKADNRIGGVGDETQIITPSLYSDTSQEKFIPIVAERDSEGKDFIPSYIKSRIFIDLSDIESFEENYEMLLRNLYKAPKHKKPALGEMPTYLFEDEVNHYKTRNILKQMRYALDRNPNRLRVMSSQFQDSFLESLTLLNYEKIEPDQIDDKVKEGIDKSFPLKDDFIEFVTILIEADKISSSDLIEFFEKMFTYTRPQRLHFELQFDHIKFLIHEVLLYTFLLLNKFNYYEIMLDMLNADYDIEVPPYSGRECDLSIFRFYLETLDNRNERLGLQKVSLHADLLIERAGKFRNELINIDILLYYFLKARKTINGWFPITYIFKGEDSIKLIRNLKSKKHVEDTKHLFNSTSAEEIKDYLKNFGLTVKYKHFYSSVPHPTKYINIDEIATKV